MNSLVAEGTVQVNVFTSGIESVDDLYNKLIKREDQLLKVAQNRAGFTNQQIQQLAKVQVQTERLNATNKIRFETELAIQRIMAENPTLQRMEAEAIHANNLAKEEANRIDEIRKAKLKENRMLLFQSAFAVFAVTINVYMLTNALARLAGENEEAAETFKTLQNSLTVAIAPMQMILGMMQIMSIAGDGLRTSIIGIASATAAVAVLWTAWNSKSKELRIALGAVGGALAGLNIGLILNRSAAYQAGIASLFNASAKASEATATTTATAATFANTIQTIANYAVKSLGVLLPVIFGSLIGALALGALVPPPQQAQTGFGEAREVMRGGMIQVHAGEPVGRGRTTGPLQGQPLIVKLMVDERELGQAVVENWSNESSAGVVSG